MTYFIFGRDGASRIVLKRENREADEKKARELTDLGWFEVQIDEEAQIEELGSPKAITSQTATTILPPLKKCDELVSPRLWRRRIAYGKTVWF